MGTKDAPCEHPPPAKTSAFAASAFIFPPRRSHFPRMAFGGAHEDFGIPPNDVRPCRAVVCTSASSFTLSRIPFGGAHEDFGIPPNDVRPCRSDVCTSVPAFTLPPHRLRRRPRSNRHPPATVIHNGLSTEKLSTSLLAALCKTFSPSRLRTRIYYNIGFALAPLWHRGPRRRAQGGGGRRQRRTPPRAVPNTAACVPNNAACVPNNTACVPKNAAWVPNYAACVPNNAAGVPNHCAQRWKCCRPTPPLPVRSPRGYLSTAAPLPADGRSAVRSPRDSLSTAAPPPVDGRTAVRSPRDSLSTAAPPPPKWEPRLRRREGKRPNGAPPHHNAHTPNAERKRYLHNSRTKTQRRTKRCAQFVIFVFTPCKLLHNFSTVLHRSPRNAPKRAQIVARRPDLPCFTAAFHRFPPESHRAKHPRCAPVLPPKNAPLRAYAKPRPHSRVRGTRQHATTCAFFTFSVRYERIGGPLKTNFCPAEGRKRGRFRSQMLKNGPQTKKSTFSFGRLVI